MKFTPYNFASTVMFHLHVPSKHKEILSCLRYAKILLEKLRSMGFDDDDILQMVIYTCEGMVREYKPRTFQYFMGIMHNFIMSYSNKSTSEAASQNYQEWIQQEIERLKNKSA